jgi:hypothetical protein
MTDPDVLANTNLSISARINDDMCAALNLLRAGLNDDNNTHWQEDHED